MGIILNVLWENLGSVSDEELKEALEMVTSAMCSSIRDSIHDNTHHGFDYHRISSFLAGYIMARRKGNLGEFWYHWNGVRFTKKSEAKSNLHITFNINFDGNENVKKIMEQLIKVDPLK